MHAPVRGVGVRPGGRLGQLHRRAVAAGPTDARQHGVRLLYTAGDAALAGRIRRDARAGSWSCTPPLSRQWRRRLIRAAVDGFALNSRPICWPVPRPRSRPDTYAWHGTPATSRTGPP